jgi:hypothetical protein
MPDFSVSGRIIDGSRSSVIAGLVGHPVVAAAHSSKYDVMFHEAAPGAVVMVVSDRENGSTVFKGYMLSAVLTTVIVGIRATFVNDKYLHIYVVDENFDSYFFYHDTDTDWPSEFAGFDFDTLPLPTGTAFGPTDIIASEDRSYATYLGGAIVSYLYDGSGKLTEEDSDTWFHSIDIGPDGNLVTVSRDDATDRVKVGIYSPTLSHISSFVDATVTATGTTLGIAVKDSGDVVISRVKGASTTFGAKGIKTVEVYNSSITSTSITKVATIPGWIAYSTPFYIPDTDKVYIH